MDTFTLSAILLQESLGFTVYVLTQPVATLAPAGDGALKVRAPAVKATTRSLRGKLMAERVGFEPTFRFKTDNALAGRRLNHSAKLSAKFVYARKQKHLSPVPFCEYLSFTTPAQPDKVANGDAKHTRPRSKTESKYVPEKCKIHHKRRNQR